MEQKDAWKSKIQGSKTTRKLKISSTDSAGSSNTNALSGTTYGGISSIEPILEELRDDTTVPKNVRLKIEKVIEVLNDNLEMSIKLSKALNELEEIADDVNLQSYTRTQVWNVISVLEKIKN